MSRYGSEREEKLLEELIDKYQTAGIIVWGEIEGAPGTYAKILVKSDGTVKVEGVTTISGSVDISDRATRLLGIVYGSQGQQLLQRATTYELIVQLSHQGSEYDARQIRLLTSSDVVDVVDRAARLLGIIYGSEGQQILQRATTYDLLVQLRHAGAEIDPRNIRALTTSDEITCYGDLAVLEQEYSSVSGYNQLVTVPYGNQGQKLLQRSSTYDLLVQLRHAGAEIDPRNIRALTASDVISAQLRGYDPASAAWQDLYTDSSNRLKTQLDSIPNPPNLDVALSTRMPSSGGTVGLETGSNDIGYILGSQGQRLLQRATTYDLLIQLRHAGSEIDPRSVNREGVQHPFSVSASAAGSTVIYTPSSGKAAQVVGWSFYCDADVITEMRFSTSGNLIAGLPTKGSHAMNLVGLTPPQGSADETIEIYVSGAANVKGWVLIKEV